MSLPQPNPHDGISYATDVPLYYRFMDSDYLLPVICDIKMQTNEMPEAAILRALISGVGTDDVYTTVIPPETELVNILEDDDMLFVTLSSDFTDNKNYNFEYEKSIAVCEILNTLTKSSPYSVQILIDSNNTGIGEVVSYQDLGFDAEYDKDKDYFSAAVFTNSILATPMFQFSCAMECLRLGDYDKAALLFCDTTNTYTDIPSALNEFFSDKMLTSFEIDDIQTISGTTIVYFSLNLLDKNDKVFHSFSELSLIFVRFGELYKVNINGFMQLIGE